MADELALLHVAFRLSPVDQDPTGRPKLANVTLEITPAPAGHDTVATVFTAATAQVEQETMMARYLTEGVYEN